MELLREIISGLKEARTGRTRCRSSAFLKTATITSEEERRTRSSRHTIERYGHSAILAPIHLNGSRKDAVPADLIVIDELHMAYDSSRGSVLESLCAKIVLWNSRTDAVPSDLVVRTIRRRKEYDPVTSDEGIALRLVFLTQHENRGTAKSMVFITGSRNVMKCSV
ncbi:hypothetical protein Q1695_008018 [Nippostrongylus brasiliensis]|nr:hypothetical protein Q1695_008018 [Nippostrongylus brasiliensis]